MIITNAVPRYPKCPHTPHQASRLDNRPQTALRDEWFDFFGPPCAGNDERLKRRDVGDARPSRGGGSDLTKGATGKPGGSLGVGGE
jgi:hypothetical protein